jgi:hypothetical protein
MSDFADLKKLAQEANKEFPAKEDIWSMVCTPTVGLELIAEIERLQGFEAAYKEFSDKTDWVKETAHWSELGMHRADVLRKRVDELQAENEVLRTDAERYRWLRAETGSGPNIQVSEWVGPHEYRLFTEELDAAIDNALSEESSHG